MELHTAMMMLRWVAAAVAIGLVGRVIFPMLQESRRRRESQDLDAYIESLERRERMGPKYY